MNNEAQFVISLKNSICAQAANMSNDTVYSTVLPFNRREVRFLILFFLMETSLVTHTVKTPSEMLYAKGWT